MSKRSQFTTITPLPSSITRQVVLDFLHDHEEMIDLNPLVKERHPIPTPPHAPLDEQACRWYSLTDKITYLPGGLAHGDVTYTCAFHDLNDGLQTHCYAPAGLTIRDKWTVGGSLPGETSRPAELGLNVPPTGLYLREDVNMKCNVFMTAFVKKTIKKSHAALVDRLKIKAEIASSNNNNRNAGNSNKNRSSAPTSFSRPLSPAATTTSVASSAVSSPSCYSAQSSPLWSPTTNSSIITSPPLSIRSPPQPAYKPGHAYSNSDPAPAASYTPFSQQWYPDRTDSIAIPGTPFFQQQQRRQQQPHNNLFCSPSHTTTDIANTPPYPETPFLKERPNREEEDWPLPSPPRSSHGNSHEKPLELEVRDTEFVQSLIPNALRIIPGGRPLVSLQQRQQQQFDKKETGLDDVALWAALGGGSGGGKRGSGQSSSSIQGQNLTSANKASYGYNQVSGRVYYGHKRGGSTGSAGSAASGKSEGGVRGYGGHPEYPMMNPYEGV